MDVTAADIEVVRAAGGVVWRPGEDDGGNCGELTVLLVHRPRYDDWSLPKGELQRGETHAEVRWLTLGEAAERLTDDRDRSLLSALADAVG
ncbi:MAG TPA: hypothetical protein VHT97_07995 [Acidimicrobiales bacterium]|nr:hypothetical protein [Acidimicrobiales bacterium]